MVKYMSEVLDRTFAALADPIRQRILAHLAPGDRSPNDFSSGSARKTATELRFRPEGLPTTEDRDGHNEDWSRRFDKLEKLFSE